MREAIARIVAALVAATAAWTAGAGCNAMFGIDELSYEGLPGGEGGSGGIGPGCDNAMLDGDETDVDCGGSCLPCANGALCIEPTDCASGQCAGDFCGPCRGDEDCAVFPGTSCNVVTGICTGNTIHGQPCNDPADCATGFCPADDGICCDSPCALTCEACLASKTGGTDGICDFVDPNLTSDPDAECPMQDVSTCGSSGAGCAGDQTACALWPQGSVCVPAACGSGVANTEALCDGLGSCGPQTITNCGGYACDGVVCRTTCSEEAHCLSTHFCDIVNMGCVAKYPTGHSCTANVQCVSGSCASGFCA